MKAKRWMKHNSTIEELLDLKDQGHRFMDEYKRVTGYGSEKAYGDLKIRMRGKAWHFGSMTDTQHVKIAIGNLKKLIAHAHYERSKIKHTAESVSS